MTMMLAQHGYTGSLVSGHLYPTDKTQTASSLATFDETRYYLSSLMHQNPKDKRIIIHTFDDGVHHISDPAKKISFRISTDQGATWGSKTTLYDPTDGVFQTQGSSVGIDRKGRCHAIIDCHTSVGTGGGSNDIRYVRSDDNWTTVSSAVTLSMPAGSTMTSCRMFGRLIDAGGDVLIANMYAFPDEGTLTTSEQWIARSTDGGDNWTWIAVKAASSVYINESEALAITNNCIVIVSRHEPTMQFYMYKSTDAGLTWSDVGILSTNIVLSIAAPPRLHKFRADNGKWYCVLYFADKSADKIYAMYGRLDNGVEAGTGLFNVNTVTLLYTDPGSKILHYGDFCHFKNNMNAKGWWARENGTFPVDNEMVYLNAPATHYNTVFALIDPVTIYDKLGNIALALAWRGLVANSTTSHGTVDSSNRVTSWNSIAPGPTGRNFTATAGGILLGTGIEFDGTKALSHGTSSTWNFMSYSSTGEADIDYTMYYKLNLGLVSNPDAVYGILGNNGASASAKGVCFFYDDRAAQSRNNALRLFISKGTAGLILDFVNDNVITPNAWHVVCVEVDLSQSTTNNKAKLYVDGVTISTTVTTYNTGVVSLPTYNLQIGAAGNSVVPGTLKIKDVVLQVQKDIPSVRANFTQALIDAS